MTLLWMGQPEPFVVPTHAHSHCNTCAVPLWYSLLLSLHQAITIQTQPSVVGMAVRQNWHLEAEAERCQLFEDSLGYMAKKKK